MLPLYVVLFQLGSIFSDFEIIMKIAGLLFIVSFVRQHIQHPILSNVIILGLSAFLLFDVWKIFGSALFLYILVSFGVLHTVVDLSFLGAFQRRPSQEEMQREQARQRAEREREMEEAREQGYEVPRRGYEEEYGDEGYGGEEDEEHSSHHMYSQGAAKARQGHGGGGSHASSGKHSSLGNLSAQMIHRMMQQRGGHGGGHR